MAFGSARLFTACLSNATIVSMVASFFDVFAPCSCSETEACAAVVGPWVDDWAFAGAINKDEQSAALASWRHG